LAGLVEKIAIVVSTSLGLYDNISDVRMSGKVRQTLVCATAGLLSETTECKIVNKRGLMGLLGLVIRVSRIIRVC
jgi:hypothetical protein